MDPDTRESFEYSVRCRHQGWSSNPTINFNLKRKTAEIFCHLGGQQTLIHEHQITHSPIVLELSNTSLTYIYRRVYDHLLVRLEPRFRSFFASLITRTAEEFGNGSSGLHVDVNVEIRDVRLIYEEVRTENEGDRNRGRGVSKEVMERLKRESRANGSDELERDDKECSICLGSLFSGPYEIIKMPCSHLFHESCIFRWLRRKKTCPVCRQVPFANRSIVRPAVMSFSVAGFLWCFGKLFCSLLVFLFKHRKTEDGG